MARQLGQSIAKILMECFLDAVVSTCHTWSKKGQLVNWHKANGAHSLMHRESESKFIWIDPTEELL